MREGLAIGRLANGRAGIWGDRGENYGERHDLIFHHTLALAYRYIIALLTGCPHKISGSPEGWIGDQGAQDDRDAFLRNAYLGMR